MSSGRDTGEASLFIEREFRAPIEAVWAAWTTPERLLQWFGPADWPAVEVTQAVTAGGRWQAILQSADGEQLVAAGHYLELEPPHHLSFTFRWESDNHEDGPGVETVVDVRLERSANGTRMAFHQRGLVSVQSASGHTGGWTSTFERLDGFLARTDPATLGV